MNLSSYATSDVPKIRITCGSDAQVQISELKWFQGNLAEASQESIDKLKRSILKHGLFLAFSVWNDGKEKHIIDGHARFGVLKDVIGYNGLVPVDFIEAANFEDAKEKVLLARSQTNKTTEEGLYEFAHEMNWQELSQLLDFADISVPLFIQGYIEENSAFVDNPLDEWQGMPEFIQEDKDAKYSVRVNFNSIDDLKKFSELIEQSITEKTKSIWFPKSERQNVLGIIEYSDAES